MDLTGNFVNPDYVTPEQAKQIREYSQQLMTGAIAPTAKHWTGALANALMGFRGQQTMDQANQQQRQLLQQGQQGLQQAGQTNPLVQMLLGGNQQPSQSQVAPPQEPVSAAQPTPPANLPVGNPMLGPRSEIPSSPTTWGDKEAVAAGLYDDPAALPKNAKPIQFQGQGDLSAFYMNPTIPPELKSTVREGLTPKSVSDVYGRPGYQTPIGGVAGTPVQGQFQPGHLVDTSVTPEGAVSTKTPLLPPGGNAPSGSLTERLQPLMDAGKNLGQQGAANKATRGQIEQDVQQAYNTIPVRQTLAAMKDDITSHGDKMVWGPTADWLNNLKRGVAQHAPGLMSQADLNGLASADSFDKLTAQLQSIVGRQVGGTDASLMQGMRSVPHSANSKQGALALIDMLDQTAKQNAQFMQQNQYKIGQPGFDLLAAKNKFFDENPIINPITKNPLRLDLGNAQNPAPGGGGWGYVGPKR